jgi:hypothetical protein
MEQEDRRREREQEQPCYKSTILVRPLAADQK